MYKRKKYRKLSKNLISPICIDLSGNIHNNKFEIHVDNAKVALDSHHNHKSQEITIFLSHLV